MKYLDWNSEREQPIVGITCYDYPSACCVASTPIDVVLVGDSVSMVVYGEPNTLSADVDLLLPHVRAVAKGLRPDQFLVADMPFLTAHLSLDTALSAAGALMKAGAHAIKVEGVEQLDGFITACLAAGIPVMGHIGLTPQRMHCLGGFRVQGREPEQAEILKAQALHLQELGCFSMVLECMPEALAQEITSMLSIPTIGAGAGRYTKGQILVWHDVLGLYPDFVPKFARRFFSGALEMTKALNSYYQHTVSGDFPVESEVY